MTNRSTTLHIIIVMFLFHSCDRIKNTTQKALNKGGETVGKSATEFIEGVGEGIDQTLALTIRVSDDLSDRGLSTGKYYVSASENGMRNKLTIYLIFENAFDGNIHLKAFDKNGLELGRTSKKISVEKEHATYYDFVFDVRTDLEDKSLILIENNSFN